MDDEPKFESMRARFKQERFNERPSRSLLNYAMISGFLRSKVGEHYNDVYSELIKKVPAKFRHELDYYLYSQCYRGWGKYYIDDEGVLRADKVRPRYQRVEHPRLLYVPSTNPLYGYYKNKDGKWFGCRLKPLPTLGDDYSSFYCRVCSEWPNYPWLSKWQAGFQKKIFGDYLYCWCKNDLSPERIKKLGLDNIH